jgi:preprotein translocase subunit SecF
MRIFANADYPFLRWRRQAYIGATALVGLGIVAMFLNVFSIGSWLRYGVDFTGGTLIHVNFDHQVEADEIRAVNPNWLSVTRFGEVTESEYVIRIPSFEDRLDVDPAQSVSTALADAFGADTFEIVRTEAVGPRVGNELQQRALLAILISLVGTLIYIAVRFEWRFGVAAVIGTAFNVVVSLGVVALLRMEVSITTVAAFLTIVGYALNDTVVVFDRIRENLQKARHALFIEVANRSINETLPRTVITGGTTLMMLLMLYLFGGAVIRDFSLVLIVGITIGTFSTIFVATPALVDIEARWRRSRSKATQSGSSKRRAAARA